MRWRLDREIEPSFLLVLGWRHLEREPDSDRVPVRDR